MSAFATVLLVMQTLKRDRQTGRQTHREERDRVKTMNHHQKKTRHGPYITIQPCRQKEKRKKEEKKVFFLNKY